MTRETNIFIQAFRRCNPTAPRPRFEIQYYRYSTLTHTIRLRQGTIKVRMSHLFHGAPGDVLRAVAEILFSKLYRRPIPEEALDRYHRFVESRQLHFRSEMTPRVPAHAAPGRHYDLNKIFDRLNHTYFHSLLARPTLGWSRRTAHTKLGEYQTLHHTIIINRRFDSAQFPAFVLEYLIFHEMLHMRHGAEIRRGRRVVHTRKFREEEKLFADFEAAKEWLHRATRRREWRENTSEF